MISRATLNQNSIVTNHPTLNEGIDFGHVLVPQPTPQQQNAIGNYMARSWGGNS